MIRELDRLPFVAGIIIQIEDINPIKEFSGEGFITVHTEVKPDLAALLELSEALGVPLLGFAQEQQSLLIELVSAELQIDRLEPAVVVVVRHSLHADVQRVAAVVVTADALDGQSADVPPGKPCRNTRRSELASPVPVPRDRKIA